MISIKEHRWCLPCQSHFSKNRFFVVSLLGGFCTCQLATKEIEWNRVESLVVLAIPLIKSHGHSPQGPAWDLPAQQAPATSSSENETWNMQKKHVVKKVAVLLNITICVGTSKQAKSNKEQKTITKGTSCSKLYAKLCQAASISSGGIPGRTANLSQKLAQSFGLKPHPWKQKIGNIICTQWTNSQEKIATWPHRRMGTNRLCRMHQVRQQMAAAWEG